MRIRSPTWARTTASDSGSAPGIRARLGVSRARFIVLEGVEGAGKTTQIGLLSTWLDGLGVEYVRAREPGGTEVGEAIRGVLLETRDEDVPAETELLLMLGARAAFVRGIVRPALDAGRVVLADRFDFSTFAYQGYGRGIDLDEVKRMNAFATGGLRPDAVLVLDLPAAEGAERQAREGGEADRIEREGTAFLERVRGGYRELADQYAEARVIDARGRPEVVHARLRDLLVGLFPETFAGAQGSCTRPGIPSSSLRAPRSVMSDARSRVVRARKRTGSPG